MLTQRLEAFPVVTPTDALPGDHHQIKTCKLLLVASKTLADNPFYPIAIDSAPTDLLGHSQSQSRMR